MSFFRLGTSSTGLIFSSSGVQKLTFPSPEYGALSDGRLWLNLDYQKDWGRNHLWIDEMRTARAWRARTASEYDNVTLRTEMMASADSDGYPTSLPSGVLGACSFILMEQGTESAPAIGGRYRLDWEGSGTISLVGAATSQTSGANYIEFDYSPTATNSVDVQITAITPGNHIRNIRCYLLSNASLLAAGKKVHPAFLAAWGTVGLLRFMQPMGTNEATEVNWSDESGPTSIGKGPSISEMIDVCNELGVHCWLNIPHLANEGYVTAMATLVRDRLNPALKCYIEYTNEWWNFAAGYVGAPYFASLASGQPYAFNEVAGAYSARAMGWWSAVFTGQMSRTVRVAGIQTNYVGLETNYLLAPNYIAAHGGPVPHTMHDAIAGTGYYFVPGGNATWEAAITTATTDYAAGLAQLKAAIFTNIDTHRDTYYPHFRNVANTYGKQFLMYEGGTHVFVPGGLSNTALAQQLCTDINTGPDAYDLFARMFEEWDAVGDGPFHQYAATQKYSANGSYGAQHYINDFSQSRYTALQEYNDGLLPATGTPVGGQTFDMFYGLNSLHNHAAGTGNLNTRVANWLARLSAQAPTPNTITFGQNFGFADIWPIPPVYGGALHEEITSPHVNYSADWINANQIEVVGMVPDNFFGLLVDPAAVNGSGWVYETEVLQWIDAWEANAPNANRKYVWYIGTPQLKQPGITYVSSENPSLYHTEAGYTQWYSDMTTYQAWNDLLVSRIQAARPSLDIRKHSVSKAVLSLHQNNAAVHAIPVGDLFYDRAPHGTSNWYFLLALVEYMYLFGEKPPTTFTFDPAWNIHSNIQSNYTTIVNYLWSVR